MAASNTERQSLRRARLAEAGLAEVPIVVPSERIEEIRKIADAWVEDWERRALGGELGEDLQLAIQDRVLRRRQRRREADDA